MSSYQQLISTAAGGSIGVSGYQQQHQQYSGATPRQRFGGGGGGGHTNGGGGELSTDELERTVQQQADTIEALHLAAAKYKNRLEIVEQSLLEREAELGSLASVSQENATLRRDCAELRESIRALEQSTARIMDKNTLGTETHAQLGVRVQAYQRHNSYLQGELSERERKLKMLQDKVDMLSEENHTKDRRIAVMIEKLRQHNIDPLGSVVSVRVPEETFAAMKVKLTSQATTIEVLHERVEAQMDELERKGALIEAVQRENKALRVSVQKLIAQVTQHAMDLVCDDGGLEGVEGTAASSSSEGGGGAGSANAAAAADSPSPAGSLAGSSPAPRLTSATSVGAEGPAKRFAAAAGEKNGFDISSNLSTIEQRLAAFRQRNPKLN